MDQETRGALTHSQVTSSEADLEDAKYHEQMAQFIVELNSRLDGVLRALEATVEVTEAHRQEIAALQTKVDALSRLALADHGLPEQIRKVLEAQAPSN